MTPSVIAPAAAYALGLASALLLFASIVLHELGHAVVARRRGVAIEGIDLWLLGGVSKLRGSPHDPGDELRYAAAGPAVTVGVTLVFGAIVIALPTGTPRSGDRIAIGAYLGKGNAFDRAITRFAERYADQNELDYRAVSDAVEAGRIEAGSDVSEALRPRHAGPAART